MDPISPVRAFTPISAQTYLTSYPGASVSANTGDTVVALSVNNIGNPNQVFTPGSGWAIPPNGAITVGTGPALMMVQTNVASGTYTGAFAGTQFDQYAQIIVALAAVSVQQPNRRARRRIHTRYIRH